MKRGHALLAMLMLAFLSACASKPEAPPPYTGIKIGKPYEVSGQWYEPHYEEHYDQIGTASWYGPGFHGGKTATGERYDQNELTAAHRTLPLPSIVRVTNLDNGKSALVRVNDRGPFAHDRIIDLSKATATRLAIIQNGTAKVRVQYLDAETRQFVKNWQQHGLQYAEDTLNGISPQLVSTEPKLRIETRTFGHTPEEEMAGNAGAGAAATAPLPPSVSVVSTPSAPLNHGASPDTLPLKRYAGQQPVRQPDIFSVVDNAKAPLLPASYRVPASTSPTPSAIIAKENHGFFVQAGTFGVEGNARRQLTKIADYGETQVMEIISGGRKLYRVMMGPFSEQNSARNMLSKLAGLGIPDAKIVRN